MAEGKTESDLALETHDLSVAYHKKPVLYGVDLTIPKGQLVGIVGPNGAGKSTLIKAVMGLLPLRSGWVEVFGQPFGKTKTQVGYVPQRESVDWDFPVNVMDVVMMGRYGKLGLFRRPKKEDREVARGVGEEEGAQLDPVVPGGVAGGLAGLRHKSVGNEWVGS